MDPLELAKVLRNRRTIRKFYEFQQIDKGILERVVQTVNCAPFSCNLQPLDYVVVSTPENCEKVFQYVTWARHLPDLAPQNGEKPSAYILPLMNVEATNTLAQAFREKGGEQLEHQAVRSFDVSYGISLGFMIAQAHIEGLGICPMAGIDDKGIRKNLKIDSCYEIVTLLALGYAREIPITFEMENEAFKYRRNSQGQLLVPKRELKVSWM